MRWRRLQGLGTEDVALLALSAVVILQLWRILGSPAAGTTHWVTGTALGLGVAAPAAVAWSLRIRAPDASTWHPWQVFTAVLLILAVLTTFTVEPLPEDVSVEAVAGSWYLAVAMLNTVAFPFLPPRRPSGRAEPGPQSRPLSRTAKFSKRRAGGRPRR